MAVDVLALFGTVEGNGDVVTILWSSGPWNCRGLGLGLKTKTKKTQIFLNIVKSIGAGSKAVYSVKSPTGAL